ncbi:hypothetical protein Ocin01_08855 [Orchesella cincta]|uniref:Uncharacterized protein n=1 Tax=Orchesella cincta TaxID=48709 RepID=A0A1D2MXQ5_ORCCI|nr:hypothetical protein Ocin01_08855 [Orchesella cincta]
MRKSQPQRRLQYLLNETYMKIDELKELIRKEACITGSNSHDATVSRMFSRQDYLVTLCAEICSQQEKRNEATGTVQRANVRPSCSFAVPSSTVEQPRSTKSEKDDAKPDGSWYGSLDRSLAKKKKHQIIDKRRRHTKTIGSMAGLDVIKKSVELQPDEQYEIGLPAAPKITSTRSSIFPMTQHQHSQPTPALLPPQVGNWGYHMDGFDENKNMRPPLQQPPNLKPNVVPLPCRSLGNDSAFRHSGKSTKTWHETNLDDCNSASVATLNPSPSPSMLSSTRGSSRGSVASGMDTVDGGVARMTITGAPNESAEFTSKSSESSESWAGTGNEVTKPFEMSDYYKYSTKFRSRNSPVSEEGQSEPRSPNGLSSSSLSLAHSRHPSQIRQASFDATNGYRDANGNPSSVGPKLPPKQRRNQNKSISGSTVIYEGDMVNGESAKDVWITNEPTFV